MCRSGRVPFPAERSLAEQNERARLNLTMDLLLRYVDRFENQLFLSRRRATDRGTFSITASWTTTWWRCRAGWDVCAFFEDLAHMQRLEALPAETVWNSFGSVIRTYWPLCKAAIEELRQEWKAPALYEEFEGLSRVLADPERARGIELPTKEQLRQVMEDEAIAGEDQAVLDE
jgi:hypothetical protein